MNIAGFDDVRFEAASELAKLYEQTGGSNNAKVVLMRATELSRQNIFWHCRLIFQTAQIGVSELDYATAGGLLQVGIEYCHIQGVAYNQLLFLLSRIMVFLLEGRSAVEVQTLLTQANQNVEQYNGAHGQKEHLRERVVPGPSQSASGFSQTTSNKIHRFLDNPISTDITKVVRSALTGFRLSGTLSEQNVFREGRQKLLLAAEEALLPSSTSPRGESLGHGANDIASLLLKHL
ncbi:MAU2 chromatid cohesion factor homolog [Macrobrachium nipponense]|uniref:MAU2 chromatid cohesion factor homolog n=1 Tax=Macrobrachium nipponense TaxID=159736 RepID=UPI0030C8410C